MVEGNVREFEWSVAGEDTLRPELVRETREMLAKLGTDQENPLGDGYELAPSDMEAIARGGIREMLDDSLLEGCGESVDGFVDDDLCFTRPWGFAVADIAVPVTVWYGHEDTLVPPAHGEWLARTIPGAEAVRLDGGHFAIYERLGELLAWLTESG
jgi:pimeloyl-ACP methyl ester carboxylesterase